MNWHWRFWERGESVDLQRAKAALEEAKNERVKMDNLSERHRKVRAENHLGEAAMKSFLARGSHT